jgi:hypothetical protein
MKLLHLEAKPHKNLLNRKNLLKVELNYTKLIFRSFWLHETTALYRLYHQLIRWLFPGEKGSLRFRY